VKNKTQKADPAFITRVQLAAQKVRMRMEDFFMEAFKKCFRANPNYWNDAKLAWRRFRERGTVSVRTRKALERVVDKILGKLATA